MSGQHVQTLGDGHRGRATSVTSSVWDTCPSAKGSSSAVAGAARMLRPGHRGQPRAWDWLGQQVVLKPQALRGTEMDAPAASLAGTKGTRGAVAASSGRGRGGWGAVTSRRAGRGRLAVGPPEAGEVSSDRRGRQEAARDGTGRPGPGARPGLAGATHRCRAGSWKRSAQNWTKVLRSVLLTPPMGLMSALEQSYLVR